MAYALVGTIGAVSVGTAGASVTPAWGASENRTAGNLLLLWVASTGSATLPGTITGWSIGLQKAGSTCSVSLYYKVATGSDAAPTVPAIASDLHNARIGEFSGGTATPKDKSGSNSGTTSPLTATAGAASVAVGELLVGVGVMRYTAAATKTISATSNHVTSLTGTQNGGTSTASHYEFAYGLTNSISGADTYAQTYTTTSIGGCAVELVTFLLPAPQNPQPTAGAATLTGAVPMVTVGAAGVTVLPTSASMTLAGATPTVTAPAVSLPTSVSLTLTGVTPPVLTPRVSLPSAASLTVSGATPAISLPIVSLPGSVALTTSLATPPVLTPRVSLPGSLALSLTGATPTVSLPTVSLPTAASLSATGAVPTVTVHVNTAVLPAAAALTLSMFAPTVTRSDNILVSPAALSLAFATFAPTVRTPQALEPLALALALAGATPDVTVTGTVTEGLASLTDTGIWAVSVSDRAPHAVCVSEVAV